MRVVKERRISQSEWVTFQLEFGCGSVSHKPGSAISMLGFESRFKEPNAATSLST